MAADHPLLLIAGAINGMAESAATQVRNLQRAEARPLRNWGLMHYSAR